MANFDNANLSMCTFENLLRKQYMGRQTLFSTDFTGCAFSEVRFEDAKFSSGKLTDCTFDRAVFIMGFGGYRLYR